MLSSAIAYTSLAMLLAITVYAVAAPVTKSPQAPTVTWEVDRDRLNNDLEESIGTSVRFV